MEGALQNFLTELSEDQADLALAILCPESAIPPVWKLSWASLRDTSERFEGRLATVPEAFRWPGQPEGVGLALLSKLGPVGVVAWPREGFQVEPERLLDVVEACREIYWEESEQKWLHLTVSLLSALKEQRRELGHALHRGPAQALTAARLELSMMGDGALALPLAQALEQASEELVRLVHGKLRGSGKDGSLESALRAELDFQTRWRELPTEGATVSLPRDDLSLTLADLWRLAGGQLQEGSENPTFMLGSAKR